MEQNYLFTVKYNGYDYYGWATQPDKKSICEELLKAMAKFYKGHLYLHGSGRTDAGTHANAQTFSAVLDLRMDIKVFIHLVNAKLPESIQIVKAKKMPLEFHARFDAKGKIYKYIVATGKYSIFEKDIKWQVNQKLDIEKMKEATKYLIGEHDFTSYCTCRVGERETHVRTIEYIKITKKGKDIIFEFKGNGFLTHMVRKIVGTLVEVGKGAIEPIEVKNILDKKSTRAGGYKALAGGLYLEKVIY